MRDTTMPLYEAQIEFPPFLGSYVVFSAGNFRGKSGRVVGYDCESTHPWIIKVDLFVPLPMT